MADIDVVPKHRSNAWLWVVIAIIAIAIIVWALTGRTPRVTEVQPPSPATAAIVAFAGGALTA